jgi:hypothetical protein
MVGSGVSLDDEGEHELKDVPGTWRLFTVVGYAGLFAQRTGTRREEMGHGAPAAASELGPFRSGLSS